MKKTVLLGTGILATALLTGCGGSSSGGSDIQKFSVADLAPIEGTDSIVGTWVGATDYVETDSGTYTIEGSDTEYPYTGAFTGSRLVILQVVGNDESGYTTTDCNGFDRASVGYNPSTAVVSVLGRDLQMTGFNQMTGTSSIAEFGEEGQESWNWVKVSNVVDNIGSFDLVVSDTQSGLSEKIETDLLAVCRESYEYQDSDGLSWTALHDSGAHTSESGDAKKFISQHESDGFGSTYLGLFSARVISEIGGIKVVVKDNSVLNYQAAYEAIQNSTGYAVDVNLKVSIAQ